MTKFLPTLLLVGGFFAATPGFSETTAPADKPAAKAKPLGSADKSFVKKSLENIYFLISIADGGKRNQLKSKEAQAVAEKLSGDLLKVWVPLATMATANGEALPSTIGAADRSKMEKVDKSGDNYDKEWLKLATKETKQMVTVLGTAAKSTDPQIKTVGTDWGVTFKAHNDELEKVEKSLSNAKK